MKVKQAKRILFAVPQDLVPTILRIATEKQTKPSVVLRYWLRLGMRQEPEIKAVLP